MLKLNVMVVHLEGAYAIEAFFKNIKCLVKSKHLWATWYSKIIIIQEAIICLVNLLAFRLKLVRCPLLSA